MTIIWTERAAFDYWQNIDFLLNRWSQIVASDFIDKVERTIIILTDLSTIGIKTNFADVRKLVITPQIVLFYKVTASEIILLRFWNTLQNPEELNLKKNI